MAEIETTANLGNTRRVERVEVQMMNGKVGDSATGFEPRGAILSFQGGDVETASSNASETTPIAVLSEATADNYRRRPRPGQRATPLVLPVTAQGMDIAASSERVHDNFMPGDAVWATKSGTSWSLNPTYSPGATFLGTANVPTGIGAFTVQLRVDSLKLPLVL